MFGRTIITTHTIVMGVFTLLLLSVTASDVQAKVKTQNCPPDEVVVGIQDGNIVCAAVESERPYLAKRYVFVSSQGYTGNLGGIVGADRKCTKLAIDAGIYRGHPFKAWLSDVNHSPAADFVKSDVQYVNVSGAKIADDYIDLTDGDIDSPINRNEYGLETNEYVWTNTDYDGTIPDTPKGCSQWRTQIPSLFGQIGISGTDIEDNWTNLLNNYNCSNMARIYCFEQ